MLVEWYNKEKTIMYCVLPKDWSIQFMHDMVTQQTELSLRNEREYDMMLNAIGVISFPKNFVSNAMNRKLDSEKDPYLRRVYIVTDSLFIRFMTRSVTQIAATMSKKFPDIRIMDSLEEALQDMKEE